MASTIRGDTQHPLGKLLVVPLPAVAEINDLSREPDGSAFKHNTRSNRANAPRSGTSFCSLGFELLLDVEGLEARIHETRQAAVK